MLGSPLPTMLTADTVNPYSVHSSIVKTSGWNMYSVSFTVTVL